MTHENQDIDCTCQQTDDVPYNLFGIRNPFDWFIVNQLSAICFVTTILLTLIICAVTFFRYIVKGDLYGYEEWVKLFAFWLYFMGAAAGAYNRTHVSADLVNAYLDDGVLKKGLIIIRNIITVGVCLLFTWYCYKFFEFGYVGPIDISKGMAIKEWLKLAVFWLYFAGTIMFSCYIAQLVSRFLDRRITIKSEGLKKFLVGLGAFVTFVLFLLVIWIGYKFFLLAYMAPATGLAIRTTVVWRIGCWTGYLSVLLGFVIMSLYFFRDMVLSVLDFK